MAKRTVKKKKIADPCKDLLKQARQAGAIVAQVLVHFGAGYGAQRLAENPTGPLPNFQIFCEPKELRLFFNLLLSSTLRNLHKLNWETDQPLRDAVCSAAFKHGVAARKEAAAGGGCLTFDIIEETLRDIQAAECPAPTGAGGGLVCEF
jgi:hypothetical protein